MAVLDNIKKMKDQGMNDDQISQRLREQGISPREIDEAMDQNNVKSAVASYEDFSPAYPQDTSVFQPQNGGQSSDDKIEVPGYGNEQIQYQENPQYPQQQYNQQQYPEYQYQYAEPLDTEMVAEVVEQIIEEKTEDMQKKLDELSRFRIEIQGRTENLNERLRRIESSIDRLQSAVIGKVGDYGKNISDLKKEMQMTQESFSKVISPLSEHMKELRKIADGMKEKKTSKKKKSDSKS
jgi:DNA-binding transcriptional MerR regulator